MTTGADPAACPGPPAAARSNEPHVFVVRATGRCQYVTAGGRVCGMTLDEHLAHPFDSGEQPSDETCGELPDGGYRCIPWMPCNRTDGCLLPDDYPTGPERA